MRETLRAQRPGGADACSAGASAARWRDARALIDPASPARNLVLLTTPVDTSGSLYAKWVGRDDFDVDYVADTLGAIPGAGVDFVNKMMKPVTNFWTTYRPPGARSWTGTTRARGLPDDGELGGRQPALPRRAPTASGSRDVPAQPLVAGTMRLRGERVDLRNIEQNLLVVTAGADHIAPRPGRCRCSTSCRARTSSTSTALAATSASWQARGLETRSGPRSPAGWPSARTPEANRHEEGKTRGSATERPRSSTGSRHGPRAARRPRRARHRRHPRHRRRDLPQPGRPGRGRRRRLHARPTSAPSSSSRT